MAKLDWEQILAKAARIVRSYDAGVTLRQLFYRLVAAQVIPNLNSTYKTLSAKTAEARRQGEFPALVDQTRIIHRLRYFDGPADARDWLSKIYRRDRTEGQEYAVYLGVEKRAIVGLLSRWFDELGVRILALAGYASQTYVDDIVEDVEADGRPAVLLYAGDWDASGEDIERDLLARCGAFDQVVRVALTEAQVEEYDLPENPGKASDSRAAGFEARHGKLVQVEVDALPPDVLRQLFEDSMRPFVDKSIVDRVLEQEFEERLSLRRRGA